MIKRNLIIIPYGTPAWGIASDNMKAVLKSLKAPTDVAYLLPLWVWFMLKTITTQCSLALLTQRKRHLKTNRITGPLLVTS